MARYYEYKCKGCGYTVNANPKGHDMIMMGEQYTYHCEDCQEIVHVLYPMVRSQRRSFALSVAQSI